MRRIFLADDRKIRYNKKVRPEGSGGALAVRLGGALTRTTREFFHEAKKNYRCAALRDPAAQPVQFQDPGGKLQLAQRPSDMPTKQAAAAVGQCELMYAYDKLFFYCVSSLPR